MYLRAKLRRKRAKMESRRSYRMESACGCRSKTLIVHCIQFSSRNPLLLILLLLSLMNLQKFTIFVSLSAVMNIIYTLNSQFKKIREFSVVKLETLKNNKQVPGWFSQGLARPESPPYKHKEVLDEPLEAAVGEWPPSVVGAPVRPWWSRGG